MRILFVSSRDRLSASAIATKCRIRDAKLRRINCGAAHCGVERHITIYVLIRKCF
jgi:hypothetical protein